MPSRGVKVHVELFLKAALIGLSIAAPVGPIGLLCIQRTLARGARIGFLSGLGAATADAAYGAIGAFGLATVTGYFVALATPLAVCGALFLGWMGVKLLRGTPASGSAIAGNTGNASNGAFAGQAFASVFALTFTNPMTILSFIAVFAAIAGPAAPAPGTAAIMVLGIFSGSALWWLTLACGVAAIRHKIGPRLMLAINRIGGSVLLCFAAWQMLRVTG